jgi:hypothetical protein
VTPDYTTNDPKGWGGDPKRGAALGRPSIHEGFIEGKMVLRRIRLDRGGYDSNGTYFGVGMPLYWYADEGGSVDDVLRAPDRASAKAEILKKYPKARFYR